MNERYSNLMNKIPSGTIHLRDDRKKTNWTVNINSFYLSRYLVTKELYTAVTQQRSVAKEDGALEPAVNVSWNEAISFCNLLSQESGLKECYSFKKDSEEVICDWTADGYRLPTEAEWQFACQAGTTSWRYDELDEIAWYKENSNGGIHQVGEKKPNDFGLYDMLGNAWEWCWDLYDEEVYGSYRIFRGGSWAEEARGCGATNRRRSHPTFCIDDLGFRIAKSIKTVD